MNICCRETEIHKETCLTRFGYSIVPNIKRCSLCRKLQGVNRVTFYNTEKEEAAICFVCAYLQATEADKDENDLDVVELFCDGGLIAQKKHGGVYAWCGINSKGKRIIRGSALVMQVKEGRYITNNHTEQIAIVKALEFIDQGWSGQLSSDSTVALGRVFQSHATKNLSQNIIERSKAAVIKVGKVKTRLLQGHPTEIDLLNGFGQRRGLPVSIHNVWCDEECERLKAEFYKELRADVN